MKSIAFVVVAGAFFLLTHALRAENTVIVHEWGTFTCLQDENGQAIGGINVDDEPVPHFVWGYETVHASDKATFGLPPYNDRSKGWRPADADVTMRLETPVVYFYPPKGGAASGSLPLQIHVDFQGGLLSQYYPYAEPNGFPAAFPYNQTVHIGSLLSGLTWKDVRLGSTEEPVSTEDKVWTTPREVGASVIQVQAQLYNGHGGFETKPQAEHFLFYRGLGHLDSPICVQPDGSGKGSIEISSRGSKGVKELPSAWIVEVRSDGSCAERQVTEKFLGRTSQLHFPAAFSNSDFSADNLPKLKASMQDALVREGLYPDEATAMLKTWELSYFKSPGLRFFYIVPRPWVDEVLPLKITGAPTDITRVMIGRIELISDSQKAMLARLAAGPCPDLAAIKKAANVALSSGKFSEAEKLAFSRGERPLSDLGFKIPRLVGDYLSLGRFRDALIVHEQQRHPTSSLAQFIKINQLALEP